MTSWYKTSWDPYTLDSKFLKRLAAFDDGRIRLRWSVDKNKWAVERKVLCGIEYVPRMDEWKKRIDIKTGKQYVVPNETYILARDGYIIIDYLHAHPEPKDWIIENLRYSDIRRWGGSKQFTRKLEAQERLREEHKEKARKEKFRHLASEAWEDLKRKYGERVFVPRKFAD
jgi:hypothetical protein